MPKQNLLNFSDFMNGDEPVKFFPFVCFRDDRKEKKLVIIVSKFSAKRNSHNVNEREQIKSMKPLSAHIHR